MALTWCLGTVPVQVSAADLKVLYLGDSGHHQPKARFDQLQPVLAKRGIEITYTDDLKQLELANLKKYAGLIVYANTTELPAAQESALLEYVAGGGGFIPLHCASYCFLNSPTYIDLVGAQFKKHGGEVFATEIVQPEHPIMKVSAVSRVGMKPTFTLNTTIAIASCSKCVALAAKKMAMRLSHGLGFEHMAMDASSIPLGVTTNAPGRTQVFRT